MSTILVDVDDVVVNLCPLWVQEFRKVVPEIPDLLSQDWQEWDLAHLVPEQHLETLFGLLNHDIYKQIQPVDGALEGVNWIRRNGHRVVFVTTSTRDHAGAKFDVLVRYGFLEPERYPMNYVEICDKSLIRGDIIVDDRPKTCHNFEKSGGRSILFKRQFQKTHLPYDLRKGLLTADNWAEVCDNIDFLLRGFTVKA